MINNCLPQQNSVFESITLDADAVKVYNDELFQDSYEAEYWRRRQSSNSKRSESYRRFRRKVSDKKRHCINHSDFKREKRWYGYDERYFDFEEYQYETRGLVKQFASNNRVFCPCCYKHKVLFETEAQANNFIKFNQDVIEATNGYAPVRSYYCPLCCGWHVTSLDEALWRDEPSTAERILDEHHNMKETIEERMAKKLPDDDTSEDVSRDQLLNEIKALFLAEMEVFMEAYRRKDLEACKAIHTKYTQLFSSLNVECKTITKIKNRLASAQQNIDKLTRDLAREEDEKKKLIWGIQQVFRQKYDQFNHAFALRKTTECYEIFFNLTRALSSFPIDMPFIKAIRRKMDIMEQRLESLEEIVERKRTNTSTITLYEKELRPAI